MRERVVEVALIARVEAAGGICRKFVSPGRVGTPDRICFYPGGRVVLVECKAPGEKITERQRLEHEVYRALGFEVQVIDSK